jgi:predicted transcriptional regulator of viral defense system
MHYKSNNKLKTLGPKAAYLVAALYDQNKPIFCLKEVQKILNLSKASSSNFMRKLVNRGVATRLKPGLFILVPYELGSGYEYAGEPLIVAREIMGGKSYYISHGTAMEIYGMTTQSQLVIYITTLDSHRPISILGTEYRFICSQKKLFFGLDDYWITKQQKVKVSNLERTIIDCLKHPQYSGGLTEIAKGLWMRQHDISVARLVEYAVNVHVGAVMRRLGFLLELYDIGTSKDLELLQGHLTETYTLLDPLLPSEGKFLSPIWIRPLRNVPVVNMTV